MKKLLVLLLAMLMAFSFIACDNSGNNSGNDPIVPSQEKTYEIMSIIQETMPLVLSPKDEVEENGDTITVLNDSLLYYRRNVKSSLQSNKKAFPLEFVKAFTGIQNTLIEMGVYEDVKKSFSIAIASGLLRFIIS